MNFKYVPVIRFRGEERKAFRETTISNKIVPLVEIMTAKPQVNSNTDCINKFIDEFSSYKTNIMLDFPLYLKLQSKTKKPFSQFISGIQNNLSLRVSYFMNKRLQAMKNLVPVVTYNPYKPFQTGILLQEEMQLRKTYPKIAFRIFQQHFTNALNEVAQCIKEGDILLFDIDEEHHQNSLLTLDYQKIHTINHDGKIKTVLIRSAIPKVLTNTGLNNNQIIPQADNSLLKDYKKLGFDAFGDYVGVKKDDITDGGMPSPGYIMYSWKQNAYYGFKGDFKKLVTFETKVVPSVLNSLVWKEYSSLHHCDCYGCSSVENISKSIKNGKSQPEWKGFAASHYLYTMEEFL